MICKYCGNTLSKEQLSCNQCGKPVSPLVEGNEIWDMDQLLGPNSPGKQTAPVAQKPAKPVPTADTTVRKPAKSQPAADTTVTKPAKPVPTADTAGEKQEPKRSVVTIIFPVLCAVLVIVIVVGIIRIWRDSQNLQETQETLQQTEDSLREKEDSLQQANTTITDQQGDNEELQEQLNQVQAAYDEVQEQLEQAQSAYTELQTKQVSDPSGDADQGEWDPENNTYDNLPVETTDALVLTLNNNNEYQIEGEDAANITDYCWQVSNTADSASDQEEWWTRDSAEEVCPVRFGTDLENLRYRCIAVVNGKAYAVYVKETEDTAEAAAEDTPADAPQETPADAAQGTVGNQ